MSAENTTPQNQESNSSSTIDFASYNISNLPDDTKAKIRELQNRLQNTPSAPFPDGAPNWVTLGTLYRFLEAHKYDIDASVRAITETNQWRQEANIDNLNADTDFIASIRKLKGSFCIGRGNNDEVVCYICPVNNPHTFEEKRLYSIYLLEEALKHVEEPKKRSTIWLLDFSRMSGSSDEHTAKDKDRRKLSRESMKMVMKHYPNTMQRMFFINPPFFFRLLWSFLSLFIEKTTYEKIQIVTGDQVGPELLKWIPADQLDQRYGGDLKITDAMKENWHKLLAGESLHAAEDEAMD